MKEGLANGKNPALTPKHVAIVLRQSSSSPMTAPNTQQHSARLRKTFCSPINCRALYTTLTCLDIVKNTAHCLKPSSACQNRQRSYRSRWNLANSARTLGTSASGVVTQQTPVTTKGIYAFHVRDAEARVDGQRPGSSTRADSQPIPVFVAAHPRTFVTRSSTAT
jgi:hypothetical protein